MKKISIKVIEEEFEFCTDQGSNILKEIHKFYRYLGLKQVKKEEVVIFRKLFDTGNFAVFLKEFMKIHPNINIVHYFEESLPNKDFIQNYLFIGAFTNSNEISYEFSIFGKTFTVSVYPETTKAVSWCIEDIHTRAKELAEDEENYEKEYDVTQFQGILEQVFKNYDAGIGITWDTFDELIYEAKIKKE